jgi:hypothetical protein
MENDIPDEIILIADSLKNNSIHKVHEKLIALLNELINKDFNSLIQLLYRIDVSEKKIQFYLNQKTNEDSASVLADLIIERQLQKTETGKKFSQKNNNKDDEEKW